MDSIKLRIAITEKWIGVYRTAEAPRVYIIRIMYSGNVFISYNNLLGSPEYASLFTLRPILYESVLHNDYCVVQSGL